LSRLIRGVGPPGETLHVPADLEGGGCGRGPGLERRADELRKAYREGFEAGRREAEKATEQRLGELLEGLEILGRDLVEYRSGLLEQVQSQAVALSFAIAHKIVDAKLREDRTLVISTVRKALQRVAERDRISIRVNPADLETIRKMRDGWADVVEGVGKLEVIADRRVDPGGCVVATDSGTVDARISSQMKELENIVANVMAEDGQSRS